MPAPVARQEGDVATAQRAQHVVVRRAAEGRGDVEFFLGFKTGHAVEPAAADDADFRFQCLFSCSGEAPGELVGRTPWSAADAPVGLLAPCKMPTSLCRQRDEGV